MLKHRILYLQYTNPAGYPPLEQGSRILANQGWHVLFIGTGAQGANVLEFPPHPGIEVRRLKFCPSGWRQKLHYFYYAFWVFGWVLRWRPQWIYASDPHSCPIALALNFVPGLRIAYHEHDSPASSLHPPPSTFQRLCLWTRRKLAHRAALCILPNERRVELFKEQTGTTQPVLCVWNCPRREEALRAKPEMLKLEMRKREEEGGLKSDIRDQRSQDGGRKSEVGHAAGVSRVTSTLHSAREDGHHASRFIVFYHGSIVPARLPMTVIEALARLPEHVVLRIAGYETGGAGGYVNQLQARAAQLGIAKRFDYLGAFSRNELMDKCREADVGLAFMPTDATDINLQAMIGASNKPFDYLACGLALLVSDLPDWKGMFVEPGYGLACNPNDSQSIAQALRWFIEHPDETRHMGEIGRGKVSTDWNYETCFQPVPTKLVSN